MAYIKILSLATARHISSTAKYIENPDKTEQSEYVTGYACEPSTAASDFLETKLMAQRVSRRPNQKANPHEAYHIIQSFAPGEVTPEQAHEIGQKLANEFLGGRFEYVIATHTDKNHVHNHILINSVSFYDYKKLYTTPYKTIAQLRDINDRLALENDLSVIAHPGRLGYSYKEWSERRNGTSWKSEIRKRLNFILARATSYEEFVQYCAQLHLYFNDKGKQTQFRLPGQERNVRGDTLDKDTGLYTADGIRNRCAENLDRQIELRKLLRTAIPKCSNLEELIAELKEQDVQFRETYQGLRWTADGISRNEHELGSSFSKSDLLKAIDAGEYEPETQQRDIEAEWTDHEQKQHPDDTVQVTIPESMIEKIGESGLLIRAENIGQLFLSNYLLDFDEASKHYIFHVQPKLLYPLVPKKPNPDLRLSDQHSEKR